MPEARTTVTTLAGVAVVVCLFWLFLLRPVEAPEIAARFAPTCRNDDGREILTSLITVCMPADALASTQVTADGSVIDFAIPGSPGRLTLVLGGKPATPVHEAPSIRISMCRGFRVTDARWMRADGLHARQIIATDVAIGYEWSTPAVSENFDRILDTWACR